MDRKEQPGPIEREVQQGLSIHALGGLRPRDWRNVIDKIAGSFKNRSLYDPQDWRKELPSKSDIDSFDEHIATYANRVLVGELPAGGFDARNYLGRRHWARIAYAFPLNGVDRKPLGRVEERKGRILGLRTIQTFAFSPTQESEIALFAALEESASFTLNDYIYTQRLGLTNTVESMPTEKLAKEEIQKLGRYDSFSDKLIWKPNLQEWQTRLKYIESYNSRGGELLYYEDGVIYKTATEETPGQVPVYAPEFHDEREHYILVPLEDKKKQDLRSLWMMTPEDISDEQLIHTPPESLTQRLWEKGEKNPEAIAREFTRDNRVIIKLPWAKEYPSEQIREYMKQVVALHGEGSVHLNIPRIQNPKYKIDVLEINMYIERQRTTRGVVEKPL